MSTTKYYFSATGNSLFIARKLADKLGDCRVISMTAGHNPGPVGGPGESVGFVFPVYFIGPPRLVKRFVEALDIQPMTYCFAVLSCGGRGMDTLGMLQDILRAKGSVLSYGEGIKMPSTWVLKYESPTGAKLEELFKKAEAALERAAQDISTRKCKKIGRFWRPLSKHFNKTIYTGIEAWDTAFRVNDRCTGCGLCANVCPVNNIVLKDKKPEWQHRCERCLACAHWCPLTAIDYGKETAGRRRYHHPEIMAQDIGAGKT
jgi:ferredoxin